MVVRIPEDLWCHLENAYSTGWLSGHLRNQMEQHEADAAFAKQLDEIIEHLQEGWRHHYHVEPNNDKLDKVLGKVVDELECVRLALEGEKK